MNPRTAEEQRAKALLRHNEPHDCTREDAASACDFNRFLRTALAVEPVPAPPAPDVEAAWEVLRQNLYITKEEWVRRRPIIEAAIRQSPNIDVELLARALDRHFKGIHVRFPDATEVSRRDAAAIAREYAAIATPPEPEPGEDA